MDVTGYLQGKLEIPWNGISMANHLVMSEEFLDSLLPMYQYLEPSLKIGILFSLMLMKRRDLNEKILKVLTLSETEKDDWICFMLPLVKQVTTVLQGKGHASETIDLDVISRKSRIFSEIYNKINNLLDKNRTYFECKHLAYMTSANATSPTNASDFIKPIDREERRKFLEQNYYNNHSIKSEPTKVTTTATPAKSSILSNSKFYGGSSNGPKTPLSDVSSASSVRSRQSLLVGTPKTPSQRNVRMMLIDDEESSLIMKGLEASKRQEKLDLEREQELLKQRRKKELEDRKLAKIQDAEERKREREERKQAKFQELEVKRLKLVAEKTARQQNTVTESPMASPTASVDNNALFAALFENANVLNPADKLKIIDFVTNDGRTLSSNSVIEHIVMNEVSIKDPVSGAEVLESIVFEMNHETKSWRKIRRKRTLHQQ